jgi:hypothetical protein
MHKYTRNYKHIHIYTNIYTQTQSTYKQHHIFHFSHQTSPIIAYTISSQYIYTHICIYQNLWICLHLYIYIHKHIDKHKSPTNSPTYFIPHIKLLSYHSQHYFIPIYIYTHMYLSRFMDIFTPIHIHT